MMGLLTTACLNEENYLRTSAAQNNRHFAELIYFDQMSTDKSRKVIRSVASARIENNSSGTFNEKERVEYLAKLFEESECEFYFNLDADEFIWQMGSASLAETMKGVTDEATIYCKWLNIHPDGTKCWSAGYKAFGYKGRNPGFEGAKFHSDRVKIVEKKVYLDDFYVFHMQYMSLKNFYSKVQWYVLKEFRNRTSLVKVFRTYMHMEAPIRFYQNCVALPANLDFLTVDGLLDAWAERARSSKKNNCLSSNQRGMLGYLEDRHSGEDGEFTTFLLRYLWASNKYQNNIIIRGIDKMLSFLF
jgi:hypothetical protein